MSRFLRKKMYRKHRIDGETEMDLVANGWNSWEWSGNESLFEVHAKQVARPDLLSIRIYGTDVYWWVLLKYNKIDDPWNDIKAGMTLKCPAQSEIDRFYNTVTKRDELKL